jgi:hypothetical protein
MDYEEVMTLIEQIEASKNTRILLRRDAVLEALGALRDARQERAAVLPDEGRDAVDD